MPSLRETILAANDRPRTAVAVPEWGVTVYAAPLSSAQQIDYAAAVANKPDNLRRAMFLIFGTSDEAGQPIFTIADAEALAGKNWKSLDSVAEAIFAKTPTVTDAKKNS